MKYTKINMDESAMEATIKVSVLVVSRSTDLLNQMLKSLEAGYTGSADSIEVIISWNGTAEEEALINSGPFGAEIANRKPYHFASNINTLAHKATGDVLIFANDDLIMDPGSVDAAINRLNTQPEVGIVGARLRTSSGQLAHAGIHFTSDGRPYHQLGLLVNEHHQASQRERLVPAVTGAFFAMRRTEFLGIKLDENFQVCGEDVLLCLKTRTQLNKDVLYCPAMAGIHDAETTRRQQAEQEANPLDMQKMREGWLEMVQLASNKSLGIELKAAQHEAEDLRKRCLGLMKLESENLLLKAQIKIQSCQLEALHTKQSLELSLKEGESKRLQSRIQQLENQLEHSGRQ
ncbi:glycosyltransferase [Cyanobium sp. WAJ14-Wanaka]|uniref:glycosyltransferase n=1 Tax=Cyanobium sp. WAJ14-Wanaka TaxID=2823725 RepID=UPI0020CC411B|nr:glycosyltransferase [Cyanobium sp. WAJ14-Wanaka]MCP9775703.1 glycosyltransferase [Cyanobium sp. WAJ14-Wanaka]